MNITLDDSVAAILQAKAAAQGMTVQAYLENLLLSASAPQSPRLSLEELERLLDEEASTRTSPTGTFSRAELYSDHD